MAGKCDLPLHGLTVVVDTSGPRLYIGRFDFQDEKKIVLNDAEIRDLPPDASKDTYLARAARLGVFKNTDRVSIPQEEAVSVRLLSEIDAV